MYNRNPTPRLRNMRAKWVDSTVTDIKRLCYCYFPPNWPPAGAPVGAPELAPARASAGAPELAPAGAPAGACARASPGRDLNRGKYQEIVRCVYIRRSMV